MVNVRRSGVLIGYGDGMSAPRHGREHDNTMIPLAQAPGLVELARRARAHEQTTLTEAGADNVLIMSVGDHQAILDWETAFALGDKGDPAERCQRGGHSLPDVHRDGCAFLPLLGISSARDRPVEHVDRRERRVREGTLALRPREPTFGVRSVGVATREPAVNRRSLLALSRVP